MLITDFNFFLIIPKTFNNFTKIKKYEYYIKQVQLALQTLLEHFF